MSTFTYDLWYGLPGTSHYTDKVTVEAGSADEAIKIATWIWDTLTAKGYYVQQRPDRNQPLLTL